MNIYPIKTINIHNPGSVLPVEINIFKGTVSRDFLLQVFFMNHLPPSPIIIISKIRGDIGKSRCTTGVNDTGGKFATGGKFCHQFPLCCLHRWQIMWAISGCRHLKVNLTAKIYIYDSSTTQRWTNKIIIIFLIEDWAANTSANFWKNLKWS
jgi:hypothetical protein